MWVPAGLVLTLTGIALFAAWIGDAGRRSRPDAPGPIENGATAE
jgi:hypothetical protein